uniref:Retrovirus-related Pol polyprotein from transposon TNT 1-94 n=1 Tax=Tanacetum cinerariifolium TaxID=118510 RepID=A0A6L2NFD8_TANCI|nr:hypothetical protein [Tanacetum cinerariifolium]
MLLVQAKELGQVLDKEQLAFLADVQDTHTTITHNAAFQTDDLNAYDSDYVEDDGQIQNKKYAELTEQEQLQDDYDVQATNIVLQDFLPDVGLLVRVRRKMLQALGEIMLQVKQGWLSVTIVKAKELGQVLDKEQLAFLADLGVADVQDTHITIIHNAAFQTNDLDAYDSDCDDISSAKTILMANLLSYDSDVLSEVPHSDNYQNDMTNKSV